MTTKAMGVDFIAVPTPWDVGDVNVVLLRNADCVTLVDTGPLTAGAEEALLQGLRNCGLTMADIDQVVLTHHHVDHVGLLARIVEESGAKVHAHPLTDRLIGREERLMNNRVDAYREIYARMGVPAALVEKALANLLHYRNYIGPGAVDAVLAEGDSLPGMPEWGVVYTPGHAQDHLSLHRAEDGVMVLGDHLIRHISSNALIEPAHAPELPRPLTLMMYRESLRKVAQLDWKIGFPGHGGLITEYRELIEKRLAGGEKRAQALLDLVRSGQETPWEMTLAMFPKHLHQLPLVLSEVLGHLDWLEADGRLRAEERGGVWHYAATEEGRENR